MSTNFWDGFEKRAKLTDKQRASYEKEMHAFNKEHAGDTGKMVRRVAPRVALIGAASGAASGAISGGRSGLARRGLIGGVVGGLAGAGLGAGLGAAGAYSWRHRSPDYLKKVTDKGLEHGIKGVRSYRAGDKDALNRSYLDYERKRK